MTYRHFVFGVITRVLRDCLNITVNDGVMMCDTTLRTSAVMLSIPVALEDLRFCKRKATLLTLISEK